MPAKTAVERGEDAVKDRAGASENLEICHRVPGRLRVKARFIRDMPLSPRDLEHRLTRGSGVKAVRVRKTTGSVIILYDPGAQDQEEILRRIGQGLREASRAGPSPEGPRTPDTPISRRSTRTKASIPWHLANALALTAFMAYGLFRRLVAGRPPGDPRWPWRLPTSP